MSPELLEFVDQMLSATPFDVVADYFPTSVTWTSSTIWRHSVACPPRSSAVPPTGSHRSGTPAAERIPGSRLLECEGAGHMVILERHDQVNAEFDQLITAATSRAAAR